MMDTMKRILLTLATLALVIPAKAQMTPEAVMGMTPDLPTVAALLNHWKEHHDPLRTEAPDSDILNEFMEAWRSARTQIDDMQSKTLGSSVKRDVMAGKVAGTGMTAREAASMSEADAKALAMSAMKGRLSGLGLSQADLARMQGGSLSKAEEEALASKMMAARTGGMTMKDMEAMSHMTDEQRMAFMQESGLGDAVSAKMAADKGRGAADKRKYQLVTEMTSLSRKEYDLQQKAIGMIDAVRKEGLALFDRKYRKADEAFRAEIQAAAIPEKDPDFDYEAGRARLRAALSGWFGNMSRFYAEYIPMYRDAVAGAMDCCRAQLLPVKKQRQEVMEQLYALTGSAEYAVSAPVPFEASSLYFDLSKEIVGFELETDGE